MTDTHVEIDADTRRAAINATCRLLAGVVIDPAGTIRDLEMAAVGTAERLAEWIVTGTYDWQTDDPQDLRRRLDSVTGQAMHDRATLNRIRDLAGMYGDSGCVPVEALRAALTGQETTR